MIYRPDAPEQRYAGSAHTETDAEETLGRLSDTIWELLLDQFVSIPGLASLTLTQVRLLYWIRELTPATWQQACQTSGSSRIAMARMIGKLARRGLVVRCGDRFAPSIVYLRVSDSGMALLSHIDACQRNSFRMLLNRLSAEELSGFSHSLDRLLQTETPPLQG